jgi:preprotein translocase subunit SecY
LKKEGETGRKKLNQYTRYLTVMITLVQGYLAVRGLESQSVRRHQRRSSSPGFLFELAGTVSLVGGTLFLMWIGEQITSRGIGNGVSLIIMAGIVARLPQASASCSRAAAPARCRRPDGHRHHRPRVALILFICFMERAQRRVLIQYPKRQTARGMQQERSHLPIKLNTAGVIPPIFASSLLLMPLTVAAVGRQPRRRGRHQRLADHHQHLPPARLAAYMRSTASASPSSASSTPRCSSTARRRRTI